MTEFRHAPAVWSDDTQQALVLVEATVRDGVPDPDRVGRRYVQMRETGPWGFCVHRGTGSGFRAAVDVFAKSGDWRTSGNLDRAGNGAAMRIAPTGAALAHLSDDAFCRAVAEVSMLTHRERPTAPASLERGAKPAHREPGSTPSRRHLHLAVSAVSPARRPPCLEV